MELFDDNLRDILNENKRELKTTKDVQDLIDDWSAFTVGTLVNIYEGKVTFWDEAILDSDCNLVVNFLNLLVFWQDNVNDKEQVEFRMCFEGLCSWIVKGMTWSGFIQEDLMSFYDSYESIVNEYDFKKKKKKKCKELLKQTNDELNSFKFKFIILHIALFLTSTVNSKGQFTYSHYNPGHRHFLYKLLEIWFEKSRASKLLQILEKGFGEFIQQTLQFERQDPIGSPLSKAFRLPGFNDRVSYISFLEHMGGSKKDFEAFVRETYPPGKFGETEEGRYMDERLDRKYHFNLSLNG